MQSPTPSGNTTQMGEVIADYLQAVERGEKPDRQVILAAHADLAGELGAYFADLDCINRLAGPLQMSEAATVGPNEGRGDALPVVHYFGDYELIEEIARGGMGVVFKARQVSLNRVVALKMILSGSFASPDDVQRFRAEAEAAANLDHANILPIYEVGEHDGRPYFSMKYIEGGSLAGRIAELVTKPGEAVALLRTVARAIDYAHRRGVLHRDLKPANILLDADGTPFVTDFGLAKQIEADSGLTRTGAVVGTPSYMAPEQARAEKGLTTAVDVYSLGAILFELLTGRPPFRAGTALDTILQVIDREPDDPRKLNPAADRDLAAVALKCLAKESAQRYTTAGELADDLARWHSGEATRARPPSLVGLAWRWLLRNTAAAATVVALGATWGLCCGLAPFMTTQDYPGMAMLAEATGPLNPYSLVHRIGATPTGRFGVLGLAAALTLGFGWLLRAGAAPKSTRAALGFAAAAGLLATFLGFSLLGPVFASDHQLPLRPDRGEIRVVHRPDGTAEVSHPDREYLVRFLPAEKRALDYPGAWRDLDFMLDHSRRANRMYTASLGIWCVQLVTILFFLGLALASTWAAEYPARTGRGMVARVACYAELYAPFLVVMIAAQVLLILALSSLVPGGVNGAPWEKFFALTALLALLVALAWTGVIRRWHALARLGLYLAWGASMAAMLKAFGAF